MARVQMNCDNLGNSDGANQVATSRPGGDERTANRRVGPRRASIDAATGPSERHADRVNGGMDAGVVPDVLRLRPLPPPVEADDPRLDIGGSAPMRREISERPDALSVLDLAAHERQDHEELPQRIARTRELLDLRLRRSVVVVRAEGDRAGGRMGPRR